MNSKIKTDKSILFIGGEVQPIGKGKQKYDVYGKDMHLFKIISLVTGLAIWDIILSDEWNNFKFLNITFSNAPHYNMNDDIRLFVCVYSNGDFIRLNAISFGHKADCDILILMSDEVIS